MTYQFHTMKEIFTYFSIRIIDRQRKMIAFGYLVSIKYRVTFPLCRKSGEFFKNSSVFATNCSISIFYRKIILGESSYYLNLEFFSKFTDYRWLQRNSAPCRWQPYYRRVRLFPQHGAVLYSIIKSRIIYWIQITQYNYTNSCDKEFKRIPWN